MSESESLATENRFCFEAIDVRILSDFGLPFQRNLPAVARQHRTYIVSLVSYGFWLSNWKHRFTKFTMSANTGRDYGAVGVPEKCTADFCLVLSMLLSSHRWSCPGLIPLGTSDASVSKQIAEVQRLVRGHPDVESGQVAWTMHSAGTTLEGPWNAVTYIIGQAHQILHDQGVVRIQTDIRIGSRTDKKQTAKDKVDVVEKLLAADKN